MNTATAVALAVSVSAVALVLSPMFRRNRPRAGQGGDSGGDTGLSAMSPIYDNNDWGDRDDDRDRGGGDADSGGGDSGDSSGGDSGDSGGSSD